MGAQAREATCYKFCGEERQKKKAKSSPQRHQMRSSRSSLQNISTNKTGAFLGWAESSASPSCLLFICAFAAIVTFLLLQLIPYSITLCPFSNTYTIHSTGAVWCCLPDVWGTVHPQRHFDLETYMFILKCCLFFSSPAELIPVNVFAALRR